MELDRCGVCGHRLNEGDSTKEYCSACNAVRAGKDRNVSKIERIKERLKAIVLAQQALTKTLGTNESKASTYIEDRMKEAIKMLEE